MNHLVICLIAKIVGTADRIIDYRQRAGLAVVHEVADLRTVAELRIITGTMIRHVKDDVSYLIARVGRTHDAIVDRRRSS